MKKILFIILCASMLASCAREAEEGLTTIRVGCRYVDSGSVYATRAEIVPEIDEALSAIMPTEIPLAITRDGFKLSCLSGEEITLPYDCGYKVFGRSEQLLTNLCSARMYASREPLITVDDSINVKYGVKEYCVNAAICSFVLAWNNTAVKSVMLDGLTTGALPSFNIGSTSVCCITGEGEFDITLIPMEGQPFEARTFTITSYPDGNGIYCEAGKWYALSPAYKPEAGGAIRFVCGEWEAGGNYY